MWVVISILNQQELIRDRSIRLFTYLKELTRLRTPVIYDVRSYEKVFWFNDIPEEPECMLTLRSTDNRKANKWFEIQKPRIPELPSVPKEMQPWIITHELKKPNGDIPAVKEHLPNPEYQNLTILEDSEEEIAESEKIPEFIYFSDQVDLQKIWEDYLQLWKNWFNEYTRVIKIQAQYEKLFSIYQLQKKLGEQYELVVASGLLRWKGMGTDSVARHLLTGRAELTMDTNTGAFTLQASAEGTKPFLEQDMLEIDQRPDRDALQSIESLLQDLEDDFWNEEQMGFILRTWVNSASAEGLFENTMEATFETKPYPIVSLSPALILRKRTERGFIQAYSSIIEQLKQKDNQVPTGVHRVVDTLDEGHSKGEIFIDQEGTLSNNADRGVEEIYFPKPANEEQRRIVETLNRQDGVIVQGPPGTGKSHTIANLISHLLASGLKILVTSQTPRALKVLKEKLPEEIQSLCVNLLGNNDGAFRDLEKVVQGISYRKDLWKSDTSSLRINEFKKKLFELRKRKAETEHLLRSVRERETYTHHLLNGKYQGTAAELAIRIRTEKEWYGWLKDQIALDQEMPLNSEEAIELYHLLQLITNEMILELGHRFPDPSNLMQVEQLKNLIEQEQRLNLELETYADDIASEIYLRISDWVEEVVCKCKDSLDEIMYTYSVLVESGEEWVKKAILEIHQNKDVSWRELLQLIAKLSERLLEDARRYDTLDVQLPADIPSRQLLQDSKVLQSHLQNGGSIRFPFLLKKNIHNTLYITKSIVCNNSDEIQTLIQYLEFLLRLDKITETMQPYLNVPTKSESHSIYAAQLLRNVELLERTIQYSDQLKELHELIKSNGFPFSIHEVSQLNQLGRAVEAYLILEQKRKLDKHFESLRFTITVQIQQGDKPAHPICENLIQAIDSFSSWRVAWTR